MQPPKEFVHAIDPDESLTKALNGAVILDVRTPEEFASGHLKNAINISHETLLDRILELSEHKDREIIAYCRSGARSEYACEVLVAFGFRQAFNSGSLEDLQPVFEKAGLPRFAI